MRRNGFSVIVPTYNRAELLRLALTSVLNLRIPDGYGAEVLVIDNNCTDHTAEIVEESARTGPFEVRHIVETKQGASHSRNRALMEARYEHLVYLDDDMVVDPGWLEGYLEAYSAFQPELVVGPVEPWFEEPPSPDLTERMLNSLTSAYSRKGDEILLLPPDQGHEVPGCNFAALRSAAVEAGGFETRIDRRGDSLLGGGDSDLGWKIVVNGGRIAYSPKCRIKHFVSRQKMSPDGMRRRWRDLGRTQQAWELIRGKRIAPSRRRQLILRIGRHYASMAKAKMTGDNAASFEQELLALHLRGYVLDRNVIHKD